MSPRIFQFLPGPRLRYFVNGQIQHSTAYIYRYTRDQMDALCRLEPHEPRHKKYCNCFGKHSSTIYYRVYGVSTCTTRRNSTVRSTYIFTEFFVRNCSAAERSSLSTHKQWDYSADPQSLAFCVTKDLPNSPRSSPMICYRDANSILLSTPLYRSRVYAQNPRFKIDHQQNVKVYDISSCGKQLLIDGCICAARVKA